MRITRTTVVAVAAFALIGIGVAASPAQAAAPAHDYHGKPGLSLYTGFLHQEIPGTESMANSDLHELGDVICHSLPRLGIYTVVSTGMDAGLTMEESTTVTAAAITFLCKHEQHMIDDFS
jgi:hypothetical protein